MIKLLGCVVIFASLPNVTPGMANHSPLQVAQASSSSSIQGYCFSVATNDDLGFYREDLYSGKSSHGSGSKLRFIMNKSLTIAPILKLYKEQERGIS
jgi:hypothetical protein